MYNSSEQEFLRKLCKLCVHINNISGNGTVGEYSLKGYRNFVDFIPYIAVYIKNKHWWKSNEKLTNMPEAWYTR